MVTNTTWSTNLLHRYRECAVVCINGRMECKSGIGGVCYYNRIKMDGEGK